MRRPRLRTQHNIAVCGKLMLIAMRQYSESTFHRIANHRVPHRFGDGQTQTPRRCRTGRGRRRAHHVMQHNIRVTDPTAAFEYGDKVLIEKCIEGTEITVGVYGEDDVRALPIVEIRKPEDCEFYDLDVKYVDPTDIHRIPAQISPENYARAQELACAAHRALGCLGISRSDFIVSEDGPVILETNTIPGMTDTSLYPDEIRHTDDMTFPQVCDSLIRMGLRRAGIAC